MTKKVLAFIFGFLISTSAVFASQSTNEATPEKRWDPSETLKPGTVAPDFKRTTSTGQNISLSKFRHKVPVILYFFPGGEILGNCIKEACGFRDSFNKMQGKGVEIIGVSSDDQDFQRAFIAKYSVPFDVISDSDNSLLNLYHVPFFRGSRHKRVTFVIDKDGVISNVIQYTNDGDVHVKEATAALLLLKNH